MTRKEILALIKDALTGLEVEVNGESRTIYTQDTLFDPERQTFYPAVAVVAGQESFEVGINGLTSDHTMVINLYGYVDGATSPFPDSGDSSLSEAAENLIAAVLAELRSATFLSEVACAFSITSIGPILSEHAELENPLAYISIPLTVQWVE